MKRTSSRPSDAAELRRRAEARLREKLSEPPKGGAWTTAPEMQRLVQELQIHQIELELQNEQLEQARTEIQKALERYTDLYEFAPVGYFTLDHDGTIRQVNLTGSGLLGVDRSRLVNRRFGLFVVENSRAAFRAFAEKVSASQSQETCETMLLREGKPPFYARIEAKSFDHGQECRAVVVDITERKRLEEEILAISEREQRRIGRDLHDDVCQRLAGIQLLGDVLQRDLSSKAKPEAEQAGLIAARIRDAIVNTRNIAHGLSPVALESNGLMAALQELAENSGKLFQIGCECRFEGSVEVDDNTVATHLYRIAQEAVTNAVKHGGAKEIVIDLAESEDNFILTITDDGLGLPENFARSQGSGLQIMNYRAATIGGSLKFRRAAGRGVCVSCSFCKQHRPKYW
jgi:PAS domain S-box-containing protein